MNNIELAFYRKYKPLNFESVIGQNNVVLPLKNSLLNKKHFQSFIFYGSKGTGKTSVARIYAKAINCEKFFEFKDCCNKCRFCKLINKNQTSDILELDAASNNGVEEVRKIIETTYYSTIDLNYKVFIIDEAHMLSFQAWNAFLKTLEENNKKVVFIFATTEINKFPKTILSRCLKLNFSKINNQDLINYAKKIASSENLTLADEAYSLIADISQGSLRDCLVYLDQISVSINKGQIITKDLIEKSFNILDTQTKISTLLTAINNQTPQLKQQINWLESINTDFYVLLKDLIAYLFEFWFFLKTNDSKYLNKLSHDDCLLINVDEQTVYKAVNKLEKYLSELKNDPFNSLYFQLALIQAFFNSSSHEEIDSMAEEIEQLQNLKDQANNPYIYQPIQEEFQEEVEEDVVQTTELKQDLVHDEFKDLIQQDIESIQLDLQQEDAIKTEPKKPFKKPYSDLDFEELINKKTIISNERIQAEKYDHSLETNKSFFEEEIETNLVEEEIPLKVNINIKKKSENIVQFEDIAQEISEQFEELIDGNSNELDKQLALIQQIDNEVINDQLKLNLNETPQETLEKEVNELVQIQIQKEEKEDDYLEEQIKARSDEINQVETKDVVEQTLEVKTQETEIQSNSANDQNDIEKEVELEKQIHIQSKIEPIKSNKIEQAIHSFGNVQLRKENILDSFVFSKQGTQISYDESTHFSYQKKEEEIEFKPLTKQEEQIENTLFDKLSLEQAFDKYDEHFKFNGITFITAALKILFNYNKQETEYLKKEFKNIQKQEHNFEGYIGRDFKNDVDRILAVSKNGILVRSNNKTAINWINRNSQDINFLTFIQKTFGSVKLVIAIDADDVEKFKDILTKQKRKNQKLDDLDISSLESKIRNNDGIKEVLDAFESIGIEVIEKNE